MKEKKIRKNLRRLLRVVFPPLLVYDKFLRKKIDLLNSQKHDHKSVVAINKLGIENIKRKLLESCFSSKEVKISFLVPSRIKGNVTFNLKKLLDSIIDNASDVSLVEVLVIVDKDDYLDQYLELKNQYKNKINFKIFVSEIRHGYLKLHKYWKIGMDNISPQSKMFNLCTDDMYIEKKFFDKDLLDVDKKFSDNFYIIHTQIVDKTRLFGKNHNSQIDIDPNHRSMFYVMSTGGNPQSFFPFCSRKILDIGKELITLSSNPDEWSYILNSYAGDWYISYLGDLMSKNDMDSRIFYKNIISRNMTTVADHHVKVDEFGFRPNQYLFQVFFEKSTISHLERIVSQIKQRIKN